MERRIRGLHLIILFGFVILTYTIRLFYLQVLSEKFALRAEQTDLQEQELIPARGVMYDRNGRIYVNIEPEYNIEVVPNDLVIGDTTILEQYLGISRDTLRAKLARWRRDANRYQWKTLVQKVDVQRFGRFSEHMWQFNGMREKAMTARQYMYPIGAHFLGFINEVNEYDKERQKKNGDTLDYRYINGNLIGRTGLERQYEGILRGRKGHKTVLMDALNRETGSFAGGRYDVMPVPGEDLQLTVDVDLQDFGEQMMQNKRGSIVAIEPATGEIIAFVSAPSFDPALLSGSQLGYFHDSLEKQEQWLPLINRPLSAQYPPGSVFKMVQAMAALSEGVITPQTRFPCSGNWFRGPGNKPRCHGAHGGVDLVTGIKHSCNPYFAEVYYSFLNNRKFGSVQEGYKRWREIMSAYGIGAPLGVDLPNEKGGYLPQVDYYNRMYRNSWNGVTIYSNAIGRGEITMTPLQIANLATIFANRGWYIRPHFLRSLRNEDGGWEPLVYDRIKVPGQPEHFEWVVEGMSQVVSSGTARRANIDSIEVCGKTGTVVQKIGKDHSIFMAFAPRENPRIAVAVVVENAGFGGTWAAPIASLMIERYLTGKIKNPAKLQRILDEVILPPELPTKEGEKPEEQEEPEEERLEDE